MRLTKSAIRHRKVIEVANFTRGDFFKLGNEYIMFICEEGGFIYIAGHSLLGGLLDNHPEGEEIIVVSPKEFWDNNDSLSDN